MNRYKPHGWRNESMRHSLAARGLTSGAKFFARKRFFAKGLLDNVHEDDMAKSLRQRDIDVLQNEMIGDLSDAVDRGELTGQNRERFMKEIFANESKLYLDGHQEKEEFEEIVNRKKKSFMTIEARPHAGQFSFEKGVEK